MTYRIRFRDTGTLHISEPATLLEARSIAIALSNWNHSVEIINGSEVIEQFEPYKITV